MPHPQADALLALARRVALTTGLSVETVQVLTHRIPMTVQVIVQRTDGGDVSLEQCAALSGPLGEALDAEEVLQAPYVLEVSSPGIAEELRSDRDFVSFRGFPVEVTKLDADGLPTTRSGLLLGRDENGVQLNVRGRSVRIPRGDVLRVRLVTPSEAG